jgi:hypothetical protein
VIPAVPASTPVTTPVPAPTVAMVVLLLVQVPPPVASDSDVVRPAQILVAPVMATGVGLTLITDDAEQPPARVYIIVDVPADTPVTVPAAGSIVAIPADAELHVPPPTPLLSVVVPDTQTFMVPLMPVGSG